MSVELIDTCDLPSWAVCYLENGDSSGLEPDDIELVDSWLDQLTAGHGVLTFSYSEFEDFKPYPEFGLACDCLETEIWAQAEEVSS